MAPSSRRRCAPAAATPATRCGSSRSGSATSCPAGPAGGGFPSKGKSNAIKKVNERNRIEIIATGAEIRAVVNGKEVAKVSDSNPGQVQGRKVRFALGSRAEQEDKKVVATFKRVAVSVPDP